MSKFKIKKLKFNKQYFVDLYKYTFSKRFLTDKYLLVALFVTLQFNDTLARLLISDISLSFRPFFSNLIIIFVLMISLVFIPKKWQFRVIWFFIYSSSALAMISFVYYSYFGNFLTLGQAAQTKQLGDVKESIALLLTWKMLLFFIVPVAFNIGYKKVKPYVDEAPVHNRASGAGVLAASLVVALVINISLMTGSDVSRLTKLWNRELVVSTFGIYTYQLSDAYKVISTKYFADVESRDDAVKEFNEFYSPEKTAPITNEYTGLLAGRDVYYIHYESAQNFPIGMSIKGQEITPTLNRVASEGVYFDNFYAQESYGTSSDTEFTISTSLLPLPDGTVFVTDADKEFVTTEKLLREKNYSINAFHGNTIKFWNRTNMLPNLGYTGLYGKDELEYTQEDVLGPFGIDDGIFYQKSVNEIANIKAQHPDQSVYAQLITLTNHHPFLAGSEVSSLDLGQFEEFSPQMSDYLKSYNYSDIQLQIFFDEMEAKGLLDNAVVVIYGDHPASIPKGSYNDFINYDFENDVAVSANSEKYVDLSPKEVQELKEVPFVIWTKDKAIPQHTNSNISSMVDVSATVNNLLGVHNPYQMGYDLFNPRPYPIVFPDGSWKTNETYYDASKSKYYGKVMNEETRLVYEEYAGRLSELSRSIIYYDLEKGKVVFSYVDEDE